MYANWTGRVFAGLAAFSFCLVPAVSMHVLTPRISPTALTVLRLVIATLLLTQTVFTFGASRTSLDRKGLVWCIAIGAVGGVPIFTFAKALTRTSAAVGSITVSLYPLVIFLLLALRGESFTYRNVVNVMTGLMGATLVIGWRDQMDIVTLLLLVACLVTFSLRVVLTQWYLADCNLQTVTTVATAHN